MIKQQLTGETWAIGGNPEEIIPLHTALYNWQGIGTNRSKKGPECQFDIPSCEPSNLGSPETFMYFLVSKAKFIRARTLALLNCINPLPHLSQKGKSCWNEGQKEAISQFERIGDEKFLNYCSVNNLQEIGEIET